jgi:hypothetical protein
MTPNNEMKKQKTKISTILNYEEDNNKHNEIKKLSNTNTNNINTNNINISNKLRN